VNGCICGEVQESVVGEWEQACNAMGEVCREGMQVGVDLVCISPSTGVRARSTKKVQGGSDDLRPGPTWKARWAPTLTGDPCNALLPPADCHQSLDPCPCGLSRATALLPGVQSLPWILSVSFCDARGPRPHRHPPQRHGRIHSSKTTHPGPPPPAPANATSASSPAW